MPPENITTSPMKPLMAFGLLLLLTSAIIYLENPQDSSHSAPSITATSTAAFVPAKMPAEGELVLESPLVTMNTNKGVLEAKLAVTVNLSGQSSIVGTVLVSGVPRLEEGAKRFFLNNPKIEQSTLAGLPTNEKSRIELALREAVLIFFKERAVFAPQEAAMLNLSPLRTKLAQGA